MEFLLTDFHGYWVRVAVVITVLMYQDLAVHYGLIHFILFGI
jgi:hypothetical protein